MKHTRNLGRWIAAGVGALVLSGAGVAGATTPPSEPPADTSMGTTAETGDTSMGTTAETGDTSMGATSEAMTGAGPSDCPPIAATTESTAPAGSEVPMETTPADTAATDAATATTGGETMDTTATTAGDAIDATATSAGETMATTGTMAPMSGPFVQVAESDEYGQILVDAECRTLYVFSQDVDGEPTCVDDCAANWPPLLVTDAAVPPLADELDPSVFSIVEHPDGSQLKVGDWPLYYFANDAAPGDVNGQGVGGVWWVVGPDGTPFEEAAATDGTEPTDGSAAPAASAPAGSAPTASAPAASLPSDSAPMTTAG